MQKEILDYIESQRVGVLAVKMLDGSPHASTLHFAYIENPLTFIFLTSPSYKKVESLKEGDCLASLVIGTSEDVMKTLQMDGTAKLVDSEELRSAYFKKFPEKLDKHPDDIFFIFTPSWWRFTDWTTSQGKIILTSE